MKATRRSHRLASVLMVLALSISSTPALIGQTTPAALPTPEQFFGFQMGADRKLANWDKLLAYYQTLAKSSNKMKLVELGKSSEGRPYVAIFISSPANIAKLEHYRQIAVKLADPRGISEAEAKKLIAEGKAVTIQSFALHSSEVAASQAAAEFVYDSITRTDEEAVRNLDNVISIVMPSINPDGTQMIADWYMKYVGTPNEAASLPWLYQKYAGHDNNRDGFALNLPESRHLGQLMYRDWPPQAYMDHHQMGSNNARLFIPPYAEPIRPDGDPLVWREITWYGGHMGTKLESAGKTGVIGAAIYSGWGHMGFHWITPFHNIAGMLNESASARLATPMFVHPDQLRGGTRGLPEYEPQTTMPSLWPGGWWRVRDIVENQKIVAWSIVDLAARNREMVLSNMYLKSDAPDRARQDRRGEGVRDRHRSARSADREEACELPDGLGHRGAAGEVAVLGRRPRLRSGLVRRDDGAAEAGPGAVGAGPHLLSRTTPTRATAQGNPIRPYDMSTDTFGEFMGVRSDPIGEPFTADLAKLTAPITFRGQRGGERTERLRARRPAERQLPRRVPAARAGRRSAARVAAER